MVGSSGLVPIGGCTGCCCQGVGIPVGFKLDCVGVAPGTVATVVFLVPPARLGILTLFAASLRGLGLGSSNNSGTPTAIAAATAQGIPDMNDAERRGVR